MKVDRPVAPVADVDQASVRLLLSIVDLGSISKAARRHGLSQPSASRRIRDLERRLGLRLLERGATGARLTVEASGLVEHCRSLVHAGAVLAEAASAVRTSKPPAVTLAVSPASVRFDLPPVHAALSERLVDVELDVTVTETIDAASGVRNERFELAIVDGPNPPIGLSDHPLVERWMELVVGAAHPWWGRRSPVGVDELAATPLWLPPAGTGSRDVIDQATNLSGTAAALPVAGVGDDDLRLAQAVLGRHPAVLRSDWSAAYAVDPRNVDDGRLGGAQIPMLWRVPSVLKPRQPIRLVWKGRQPGSAAAFAVWHHLRTVRPVFGDDS